MLPNVADANRKVKPGTPFARPSLTHPKMVGAAGIVPNNMLKHKRKPVRYDCNAFALDLDKAMPQEFRPLPSSLVPAIGACAFCPPPGSVGAAHWFHPYPCSIPMK